ncbi:DUF5979 domain-containing protein, partial [Rhizobium johnstonii]|uniref:DUF5979 domain-containing protein n=1 Tax=Rhizobium johnstonii TaxID=3019933 RepID=UPI003F9E29C0
VVGSGIGFSEGVDFEYGYTCTYDGETVGSGDLTITGDGTAGPLESTVVQNLPVGIECAITETDDGGADGDPPTTPTTVVIPDEAAGVAQVVTAEFENRFTAGTIAVTKELDGNASDLPEIVDATYTVHVTCSPSKSGVPPSVAE